MNKRSHLTLAVAMLSFSGIASADFTNGPNPYNQGFGFDAPHEASWGGWTRGDAGTLYAEWDTFFDASYGTATDLTAAPDVGSANGNTYLGWSAGTFAAGTGNLYSFAVPQNYNAIVAGSVGEGPVRAVLQFESWGTEMNYSAINLNGLAPTFTEQTYFQADYPSSFGPVDLVQFLAYWDLPAELLTYNFSFGSDAHQSLAQITVDIAAVPVPGAVWLMGSALLGLAGWRRKQYSTASVG